MTSIPFAERGRRYPIDKGKLAREARYLTTAILTLRADSAGHRYEEETTKAIAAFHRRHEPTTGVPTGWREIAFGRIHSAGIAYQHAEFYRYLVACRQAGTVEYIGLAELERRP